MLYITKDHDISVLPLSVRSHNCLRRTGIQTVGAMMEYPADELINIRNMGAKSVKEILGYIQALTDGTGDYVLVEDGQRAEVCDAIIQEPIGADGIATVFLDNTGSAAQDIPIKYLPLSVRARNCLTRSGYESASQLVAITREELMNLQNMGAKTADEILAYIEKISVQRKASTTQDEDTTSGIVTVFLDDTGSAAQDIPIKDIPLSVRARNCLGRNGYECVSQLVGITREELMNVKNMGVKTADEILAYIEKITVQRKASTTQDEDTTSGNDVAAEMSSVYGEGKSVWIRELLNVKSQFPEAMGETLIYRLYESAFVRSIVKAQILQIVEDNNNEISKIALEEMLPRHLSNTTILEEILLELEASSAVEIGEVMIHRQYPSVVEFASQIQDDKMREVIQSRLEGRTLQEIGDQHGLTRERVRQLMQKGLRRKPHLREDQFTYLYDHYDFSLEDFVLAFDEPCETYNYLEMVSQRNRSKRKPLDEILTDSAIAPDYRKKAERAIFKQYISVDGVRVKLTRPDMVKHYVKTYCKELTKFDDFVLQYGQWLDSFDLGDVSALAIESRAYENHLNQSEYVLWNQWKSFRYYNVAEHDYDELLSSLDLEQYDNLEISTLKLFRDLPELMRQYDIHDEYELHNLLKKIWPSEDQKVKFKKMPTIEIGKMDRDNQVLSLLLQYAPISGEDFGKRYEEAYGIKAGSVLANYMGAFDHYYYNGIYSVDFAALPVIQYDRMKAILNCDFYLTHEIKRLYMREFPNSDESLINPYTLKTLGFRVYSGYVVKNTYPSASDYFRNLLTTDDIVDARNLNKDILRVVAYGSELYKLRADYEIVEFAPLQYINIRRLNSVGVTAELFADYCAKVSKLYEKGDYFTITSIRQTGFTHELDNLGFGEWFYASVLLEDREHFSYQRAGGTRVFLCGKSDANLGGMLVWLLEKHQKIDIYDLKDLLENQYGVVLPKEKLLTLIGDADLYYDKIMEAVYVDYDTYFEEI